MAHRDSVSPLAADGAKGEGPAPRRSRRDLSPLMALKPYVLRYPGRLALTIVALFVAAAATLAVPVGVRRMIDHGFAGSDGGLIDSYFAMMLLIGLVLAVASAARFHAVTTLGERVVADLSAAVFDKLVHLDQTFYDQSHTGELMSRLTADTTQIKGAVGTAFSQTLRNAVLLIGALVMMFVTSTKLSLLVLGAIPVIVLPLVAYGRVVRRLSRAAQDRVAASSAFASEAITQSRTMQAFGAEPAVSARFSDAVGQAYMAAQRRIGARAGLTGIAIFLVFASVVGVLWYGASEVLAASMSAGRLGQFVLFAVFAAGALGELSEVYGEITQAAGASERLSELLALAPAITSPAVPQAMPKPEGRVAFEAVSFHYAGRASVSALDGVSFAVEPGERVAVVGPSGAGKSTLFSLILRFYDPTAGVVRVDGCDARSVDLRELRRRIAVVPQDVALFADTVAANIAYGSPGADRTAIERAAKAAHASGFIAELPLGYETILGERGATLSGGQRQRIAIARAILKDAPILLLDEATSALDSDSEAKVQAALGEMMAGRTTLVIAHRLATVEGASRIVVLEKGQIADTGTHRELLARNGAYARIAALQFGQARG